MKMMMRNLTAEESEFLAVEEAKLDREHERERAWKRGWRRCPARVFLCDTKDATTWIYAAACLLLKRRYDKKDIGAFPYCSSGLMCPRLEDAK